MTDERNTQNGSQDDVGTLLRLAGKRKPVPQQRFDRVRSAAHEQWRRETQGRPRWRGLWTAASLLAAASAIIVTVLQLFPIGGGASPDRDGSIRVAALSGPAQVRETTPDPGTVSRGVSVGDLLAAGTEISTLSEGRAALRLVSGHSMRLDSATKIRWLGGNSFELEGGAVYVDSGAEARSGGALEILTPFGSVHEIGTQFEVRLGSGSIRLRLREGSVSLHRKGEIHNVAAGTELEVLADGSATRRPVSADGPEWDWAAAIAPMLDLEGRSARSFLEWVARERGWALTFADESLARSSEQILLDGSFAHLSLDQALDAVLPTCRMTYRVEQGALIVLGDPADRPAD